MGGFYDFNPHTNKWKCDKCNHESNVNGIPFFLEKQIIIQVQQAMTKWYTFAGALDDLHKLSFGVLGPLHWCTKWVEKIICHNLECKFKTDSIEFKNYLEKLYFWLKRLPHIDDNFVERQIPT